MLRIGSIFFLLLTFSHLKAEKQEEPSYYFYHNDLIGAHAFYTPYAMAMESGFEAVYDRRVDQFPLKRGIRNFVYSLEHPDKTILEYGGYKKFFMSQFVPSAKGGWTPNYLWHLVGGGFRSRLLTEYYVDHDVPYPTALAWFTLYVGHFFNESVQSELADQGSIDGLADFLFFDWVGKLLFLSDKVAEITSHTLHLTEWTFSMAYNPWEKNLINNGQQYFARIPLGESSFSLSYVTGNMHNSLCLTWKPEGFQGQWTLGPGIKPKEFQMEQGELIPQYLSLSLLLAYSVEDNPLWTLVYQQGAANFNGTLTAEERKKLPTNIILNIYPNSNWLPPGMGLTMGTLNQSVYLGIVHHFTPAGLYGVL